MTTRTPRSLRATAILFSLLALASSPPLRAAHATVGDAGNFCSHSNLADAVAAVEAAGDGPHTIWIEDRDFTETETVTIRESMTIVGGLVSCLDPAPNPHRSTEFVVDTSGPFLRVEGPSILGPRPEVRIEQIEIHGALDDTSALEILGPVDVVVRGLTASGHDRGAIVVRANADGAPSLYVGPDDVSGLLYANKNAFGDGGALVCEGAVVVLEAMIVESNSAVGDGGAIYSDGCDIELRRGMYFERNAATGRGGAIAAFGGSRVHTQSGVRYTFKDSRASAGHFLWSDDSTVELESARISTDTFVAHGNLVTLVDGSHFELIGSPTTCSDHPDPVCALLQGVATTEGGSILHLEDSSARLRHAWVGSSEVETTGAAFFGRDSELVLESVLVSNHQAPSLFRMEGDASSRLRLVHVSTADNALGDAPIVVRSTGGGGPNVQILSSILWEPGSPQLLRQENGADALDVHCVLASGFFPGSEVVETSESPYAGEGHRHLASGSEGIDFCDDSRTGDVLSDVDAEERGTDQAGVPDRRPGWTVDVGWDEYFGQSVVGFRDGFESGDLSSWSSAVR